MTPTTDPQPNDPQDASRDVLVGRRTLLKSGLIVGATTAVGASLGFVTERRTAAPSVQEAKPTFNVFGSETAEFHGVVQPGIVSRHQANLLMMAFTVREGQTPQDAQRMLRVLTQDAERLMAGKGGLADNDRELAQYPAGLTVTVGVGPHFFDRFGMPERKPHWLQDLPAYRIDQLQERWCGGDLIIQICGDDQIALSNSRRLFVSQLRSWASLRWLQDGFSGARHSRPEGETPRNLMGQVDGTVNPAGTQDNPQVFMENAGVWNGGSTLVIRRIMMILDTWEEVDRVAREDVIGRRIDSGAPLSGVHEHDEPDFDARGPLGFEKIAPYSHVRRARSENSNERIFRRSYNYDNAPESGQAHNTGLVFLSYQASIADQYMPIQQRLADLDALNEWTVPIGSAVCAILPGCREGEYLGQRIIEQAL
jgi:dye decolorizing peroxidase